MHDQSRGSPSDFTPELVHRATARLQVRLGKPVRDLQIFPHEAEDHDNLCDFWKQLKVQDQENINRLKKLIAEEVKQGCF